MQLTSLALMILQAISTGCSTCSATPATQPVATTQPAETMTTFGQPAADAADAPVVPVQTLLAEVDKYEGRFVRITGAVAEVCPKKGCWLKLGGAEEALFVKFTCPIDGRLIPTEAIGKTAIIEGTVKVKQISEAEARHYKEDAGASLEEIARIVGPQKQITVAAPAARIAGLAKAESSGAAP